MGCAPVGSTDLKSETLAGVSLQQTADIPVLEKQLGKLTDNQAIEMGGRALTFDNPHNNLRQGVYKIRI